MTPAELPIIDVAIVDGPVNPGAAPADGGALADCGGETVFIGRTRAETHAGFGPLRALDYDAYREMAAGVLRKIAEDEAARCACRFVGVRHSVGRVEVGEASVLVRVAARGREEAFSACRAIIDRLKAEAPIWKREEWATGATWREDVPAVVAKSMLHTTEPAP